MIGYPGNEGNQGLPGEKVTPSEVRQQLTYRCGSSGFHPGFVSTESVLIQMFDVLCQSISKSAVCYVICRRLMISLIVGCLHQLGVT